MNYLPPILYMIGIFALSSIPGHSKVDTLVSLHISPNLQNLLHIPEFGILALLWMQIFQKKYSLLKASFCVFIICVTYGFLDELHQFFIPGRLASLSDIILDTGGVFLGIFIYVFLIKIHKYQSSIKNITGG